MQMEGQTDRLDVADSRFSKFCESCLKRMKKKQGRKKGRKYTLEQNESIRNTILRTLQQMLLQV
jgi:hypothetical protein